jgi:flagellar biosynthesis protein FliQ
VNQDTVISVSMQAMQLAFKISMPLLLVGLVIGLLISVFQAVTQIQEQTLTFIPKIVAMGVTLVVAGPWMLNQVVTYTERLYGSIPTLVGGGLPPSS